MFLYLELNTNEDLLRFYSHINKIPSHKNCSSVGNGEFFTDIAAREASIRAKLMGNKAQSAYRRLGEKKNEPHND